MIWTLVCVDGYGNQYTVYRSNDWAALNRIALQRNERVARHIEAQGKLNRSLPDGAQRGNLHPNMLRAWHVVETVVLV